MRNDRENVIAIKILDFATRIVEYSELLETHRKYVIARQILRSGTSIGVMYMKLKMLRVKKTLYIKLK